MLHILFVAALEVKVTEDPLQKFNGPLAEMTGTGGLGFTVTSTEACSEHPLVSTKATLYVPLLETVMNELEEPVDQLYELAADALSVTLPPAQNVVGPDGVIPATPDPNFVVMTGFEVFLHPLAPVTVTV